MDNIEQNLEQLKERALLRLDTIENKPELEKWYTEYLGRKGEFNRLISDLSQLPRIKRRVIGEAANLAKQALEQAYKAHNEKLRLAALQRRIEAEHVDVTLPGRPVDIGRLHLTTQTLRQIYAIFAEMGFQVFDAPEVETDENNFQLLNIPLGHPARDMWSTFYTTTEGVLLRTHTSPGQIRAMRRYCPEPLRVILPGKCYRYEQVTARSEFMFFQVEGLAIGRRITMADLKGVLINFCRQMFGTKRQVRFRCSHFPFTEPSAEVDIDCIICGGLGCAICKHTGWLEILGCGMVHPSVLTNGGYDPNIFSGYAFGMGPERIAMLLHRIDDIRYFYSNDPRFLTQFG